jgi:hypothetical protein
MPYTAVKIRPYFTVYGCIRHFIFIYLYWEILLTGLVRTVTVIVRDTVNHDNCHKWTLTSLVKINSASVSFLVLSFDHPPLKTWTTKNLRDVMVCNIPKILLKKAYLVHQPATVITAIIFIIVSLSLGFFLKINPLSK